MDNQTMLLPMFCVVLITVAIGILTLTLRIKSVTNGDVKIKYYRTMQGQDVPEYLTRTTRCFNNMFELPVLFYIACTLFIVLNIQSTAAVVLAWLFVLSRAVHTTIHLTYNNVLHRMIIYVIGGVLILSLWLTLMFIALSN